LFFISYLLGIKYIAKNIEAKITAHNRTVHAAPAVAGLASIRLGHGLRPFPRLIAAHFASPGLCCAKPFYARPNVVNSRNVMRNAIRICCKIFNKNF
jgi:hypothetical protein